MSYRFVVLDFESLYSDDYTLSKMTTESYIRDSRFEAHGAAIRWSPNHPARWYDEPELRFILQQEDWSDVFLIAHHAQFDGLILSHHYGVSPKMWGCTLSMARLLIGNHLSVSLDSVRKHFGIPAKTTPYNLFKGKHWNEMTPDVRRQVADGCCDEVESIWKIFKTLLKDLPREELECIDATIRMFTEPELQADISKLATLWERENAVKEARLCALEISVDELQSADKFADLLRAEGIEPATKQGKNGPIYAFAKTDEFMKELQEDEDEIVRALVEARLGAKSTLVQTRAETLGWMGRRGALCVYLRYAGAHTSRWSGGDGANWQNGVPAINECVLPPDDYLLVKPDASQVECRILNFVAGQWDKIEEFREGRDPYVGNAEVFCGHPITKESHPDLRQMGKVVELQAGYQSGGPKIKATIRNKTGIIISLEEAEKWKVAYRKTHPAVEQLWKTGGRMLARLGGGDPIDWGPVTVQGGRITLPNGVPMLYELEYYRPGADEEGVNQYERDGYWRRKTRKGWEKIYGGKLVENLIQGLARVVVSQAMIRIRRMGYRVVNMRHDDLWILVPRDGNEARHTETVRIEMCRPVSWLPGCPLDAEVH